MTVFSMIALLAASAAPAAPTEVALASAIVPTAAASAVTAATAKSPDSETVCRTRFVRGQGLVNSMKSRKVCRSRAEWKASGTVVD